MTVWAKLGDGWSGGEWWLPDDAARDLVVAVQSADRKRPTKPVSDELVPQPHGGALRPRPPANGGTSFKAAKRQVLAELAAMTPAAMDRLWQLIHSPDDRVAVVAFDRWAERVWGKATNEPLAVENDPRKIDMSRLSPAERDEFHAALSTARRLASVAAGVIDA